jgi:hypothetical protein
MAHLEAADRILAPPVAVQRPTNQCLSTNVMCTAFLLWTELAGLLRMGVSPCNAATCDEAR